MIIGERYVSKQRDQCYREVGRGEVTLQYIFTTTNTENAYTYGNCLLVITTVCKIIGMQRSTEQDSSSPIDQCCFLTNAQLDAQLRSHPSEWVTHQRDLPPCHLPTLPTTANQRIARLSNANVSGDPTSHRSRVSQAGQALRTLFWLPADNQAQALVLGGVPAWAFS